MVLHDGIALWYYIMVLHYGITWWYYIMAIHGGITWWYYIVLHDDIDPVDRKYVPPTTDHTLDSSDNRFTTKTGQARQMHDRCPQHDLIRVAG